MRRIKVKYDTDMSTLVLDYALSVKEISEMKVLKGLAVEDIISQVHLFIHRGKANVLIMEFNVCSVDSGVSYIGKA